MKKILFAGLFHETHTFLREKTTAEDFRRTVWFKGEDMIRNNKGNGSPMDGFLEVAAENKWDLIPTLQLAAMPSGLVSQEVVTAFDDEFFRMLDSHVQSLDGIYLVLHGAMVSEETDDVEGELLASVQRVLKRADRHHIPVVAVLDLHANVSEKMIANSSCLYGYRENPHTDAREAAVKAARILEELLKGTTVRQFFLPSRYILPPAGVGTADLPMKALKETVAKMEEEYPEIICLNVWAGYAYADIEICGFSLSCCTQGDAEKAMACLTALNLILEDNLAYAYPKDKLLAEVLEKESSLAHPDGPVLLIEAADNIGGGTPGDGTGVLSELLESGAEGVVAIINDPESVDMCRRKGIGEHISLFVGGKTDKYHGEPVEVFGQIRFLSDGLFELENKNSHLASMLGTKISMGPCAVLENRQVTLLLTSSKTPPMDLGQLHSQGISPESARYIIVKAAVSHRQAYNPIASRSYFVDGPGLCTSNLARLPYRKARQKKLSV